MKKLLSVLLAFTLALTLAVCAFAAEPAPPEAPHEGSRFLEEARASAAPGTQSLVFDLPDVTGISAVWDGDTDTLFDLWYGPYFRPENVAITVTFAQGAPETLDHWYDGGYDWFWEVFYLYDEATGKVTFYYSDSKFVQAYVDTLKWGDDWIYEDFYATLPQAVVTVPANLRENHLKNLPKTELKAGETKQVQAAGCTLFSFKPAADGAYYFYSEKLQNCDPYAELFDVDFNYIQSNGDRADDNFGLIADLEAGKTYYLIVYAYAANANAAAKFNVGAEALEQPGPFGSLGVFFSGSWFRGHLITHGNNFHFFYNDAGWMTNFFYNLNQLIYWMRGYSN